MREGLAGLDSSAVLPTARQADRYLPFPSLPPFIPQFLTRPFVSGDQVQFLTLEGVEVEVS